MMSGWLVSIKFVHAPLFAIRDWQLTLSILSGLPLCLEGLNLAGEDDFWGSTSVLLSRESIEIFCSDTLPSHVESMSIGGGPL